MIDDWANVLESHGQADTFILDFEKAFDTPRVDSLKANYLASEYVGQH